MAKKYLILASVLAILPLFYFPLAQWIAMSPYGNRFFLEIAFGFPLFMLACFVTIAVFCAKLLVQNKTPGVAALALLISFGMFLSFGIGVRLGQKVRMAKVAPFSTRSELLVNAIKQFEQEHQKPPKTLSELVPKFLPEIPSTGLGGYPNYSYHTGEEARDQYHDNAWALSVFTPNVGINFDQILYFPMQNYPETGYSGSLERIGDWAYVHE